MDRHHHIGGLDLIRFFAASLVMIFHFAVVSWHLPISANFGVASAPHYPELSVFSVGWVGVEIFFVLSGYVIAQSADGKSAYQFLKGRAGRLMPAVWVCATITLMAVLYFGMSSLSPALVNYLKTMVLYPRGPWISNVYWTLIVEICFYAAIFILLFVNAFRYIELFAIGLTVMSAVYIAGHLVLGWKLIAAYFLAQHGCFFALGILIWLCSSSGASIGRVVVTALAVVVCLAEACTIGNGRLAGTELLLAPAIWLATVAAICLSIALPTKKSNFLRALGLMTYPLYLVHEKLGSGILRISPLTGRWVAMFLAVSVVMGLSFFMIKIEAPMRKALEKAIDRLSATILPDWMLRYLTRKTVMAST
jgi:peptidoglycan/LPS O-acetylase OafA/YrhL